MNKTLFRFIFLLLASHSALLRRLLRLMGKVKLVYTGMDDAGEMSSLYVFNAMEIYPFSLADDNFIIFVPLFNKEMCIQVMVKIYNYKEGLMKKNYQLGLR